MTGMPTAELTADSLLSYARLDGDAVRVVLGLPEGAEVAETRLFVRFQNDETRVRFPARLERSDGRARVEVSAPREQIADGVWQLKLREDGGTLYDVGARVLLNGDQPVALLFGLTDNI